MKIDQSTDFDISLKSHLLSFNPIEQRNLNNTFLAIFKGKKGKIYIFFFKLQQSNIDKKPAGITFLYKINDKYKIS